MPSPGPIVLGVERSDRSRDALALARMLARAAGTQLLVVAVYADAGRSAVMPPRAYTAALAEEAERTVAWIARAAAGVTATTRAVPGTSVARALQLIAEEERALAIVVGPSHRGAVGRVVPGSVGERLLHGAPCPVAVAPRGYRSQAPGRIRRIGAGFVAASEADEALRAALGIARRTGATVRALSVVEPQATVTLGYGPGYAELEQRARDDLATSLARTARDATRAAGEVVDGYPDDELARLSEEVDLLVCGSRGHGPLGRVMLGSVAAGVMRKAHCPVLVVPRGARDDFSALPSPVLPEVRRA